MSNNSSLPACARKAYIEKKKLSVIYEKSKSYADIVAKNEGEEEVYYEIKATAMTRQEFNEIEQRNTRYFGAATLTEWNVALLCPDRYKFVFVIMNKENLNEMFYCFEYSAEELLSFSTIPPFKINFNIPLRNQSSSPSPKGPSKSVRARGGDKEEMFKRLKDLIDYYTVKLCGRLVMPECLREKD